MIQKRYKQTEKLAQAQGLKQMLETMPVILAEIPLPEIPAMPHHNQVLRVRDINVAICSNYVGLTPKRILIDKESSEEIDLNLFVPKWEITNSNMTSVVNQNGQREFYEMEWYDDQTGEVVTTDMIEIVGENGEISTEERELEILDNEKFSIPSLPYLMLCAQNTKLPTLIQMFSQQFVSDNIDIWIKLR